MMPLIRAVIDTAALRANLETVRARAPGSKVMAVVKANAYGHGLIMTAVGLPQTDAFAVARLEEGIMLREAGITRPIILLEGVFSAEQLIEAAVHRFEVVVHDPLQVALLEAFRGSFRFTAWVKIDTGINRLGFRPEDFPAALARLRALTTPLREVRVLTHLARADERDAPTTPEQVQRFRAVTGTLGLATSIGNSAGIFGWSDAAGDWVRPGLALYGVSPFADVRGECAGAEARHDSGIRHHRPATGAARRVRGLRGRLDGTAGVAHRHSCRRLWRWHVAQSAGWFAGTDRWPARTDGGARVDGHDRGGCHGSAGTPRRHALPAVGSGIAGGGGRLPCRHHLLRDALWRAATGAARGDLISRA